MASQRTEPTTPNAPGIPAERGTSAGPAVRAKRFRVPLAVRYRAEGRMVAASAENVSQGGLFIVGAQALKPLSIVSLEVTLPGLPAFTLRAEVRHILDHAAARRTGRRPGAGVMFREAPQAFDRALRSFLFRLTRREEVGLLVTDVSSLQLLQSAGYQAAPAPPPEAVCAELEESLRPVIGVVVRDAEAAAYREALREIHAEDRVVILEGLDDLELLLPTLDQRLEGDDAPLPGGGPDSAPAWLEAIPDDNEHGPELPPPGPADRPGPRPSPAADPPRAGTDRPGTAAAAASRTGSGARTLHPVPEPRARPARGPSVPFVIVLALLTGLLGFAVGFLLYFNQPVSYRRSERSSERACPPCAAPAPPRREAEPPPR